MQNVITLNIFFLLLMGSLFMLYFNSWGCDLHQDPLEKEYPQAPASTSTFVFSYSVCQNPEGSWIPKHHLWVHGDIAVHSNRPSSPYCHLAGKWESCKCHFLMLLALEDCYQLERAGSQHQWFLFLPNLAPCFSNWLSPAHLSAAVFSGKILSPLSTVLYYLIC